MRVFICAGDVSGDLHAAYLVNKLLARDAALEIFAVGGQQLEQAKTSFLYNIVDADGFGLNNLLHKYLYFRKVFNKIICPVLQDKKPDLVILVDFYGFNIHVAKEAKKHHIKVIYYICPQIWASRFYRIKNIKKYIDEVIPIFPFEIDIYKKYKIPVFYTGNPLIDVVQSKTPAINIYQQFNLSSDEKLIGVMPGSREQEIKKVLPMILDCIKPILSDKLKFIIFVSSIKYRKLILDILENYNMILYFKLVDGSAYHLRKQLRFCLTCSGTAVTENLVLNIPTMVFYRMSPLIFLIAKTIVTVKYISIPNILADKSIIPEYIQNIDVLKVADEIRGWINSDAKIAQIKHDLNNVAKIMGQPGVIDRVAEHITEHIISS
ncbi:MAG: lipid-A-disaccharide synthase [Gammaproteobacteria bacterium]|jgi:lipid-A-disaccharide synthase